MITNTHHPDYKKRVAIISQLERLCAVCGSHSFPNPAGGMKCASCGSSEYVEVWEHMAKKFRLELWGKELDRAQHIIDEQMNFSDTCLANSEWSAPDDRDLGEAPFQTRREMGV